MTTEEFKARWEEIRSRILHPLTPEEAANIRKHFDKREAFEREMKLDARNERLKAMRIPAAHHERIDSPDPSRLAEEIRGFLLGGGLNSSFLILLGPGGVGKSFEAARACWSEWGRFVTSAEIAQRGSFDRQGWAALERPRLLVIDDLGMEPQDAGGWLAGPMFQLINARCGGIFKTIVTTNLNKPEFGARYGAGNFERLRRRWQEFATFRLVKERGE